MILAAAIAKSASNHVWFYAFTTLIVLVCVLLFLFCLHWLLRDCLEALRLRREQREERKRTAVRNHHTTHHKA